MLKNPLICLATLAAAMTLSLAFACQSGPAVDLRAERVVMVSVPEGDDKPEKYPAAFARASALVVNKMDLRGACRFRLARAVLAARSINPSMAVFEASCKSGQGLAGVAGWLLARREARFGPKAEKRGASGRRLPRKKK